MQNYSFVEQYGNCQFDATEKIMEISSTGKTSSLTLIGSLLKKKLMDWQLTR